ncbi:MAG: hypothetical protein ACU826_10660, partial [Gammaproteobacteria bacterium]
FVDVPDERRIHKKTTPLGGGILVFLAFHLGCLVLYYLVWPDYRGPLDRIWWRAFLAASGLLLVVGAIDDLRGLKPWSKLLAQAASGVGMYFLVGRDLGFFGFDTPLPVDLLIVVVWYCVIVNAFNLIDGLDGLCSGLALISSLGLASVYILQGASGNALVCLILAGACLGFLRYNFHPAKIFLGDSGSMFLGFALAGISLYAGSKSSFFVTVATPFFIAGVPIIDTLLAIWRRSIRKALSAEGAPVKIMQPDRDHLHHRLLAKGLRQHHVALLLYAVNAVIVLGGLIYLLRVNISVAFFLVIFIVGVYLLIKHVVQIELWETSRIFAHRYHEYALTRLHLIFYPIFDLLWMSLSLTLAEYVAGRGILPYSSMGDWASELPIWLMPTFILLFLTHSYNKVWRHSFFKDYLFLTLAVFSGCVFSVAVHCLANGGLDFHIVNQALLYCFFTFIGVVGIRIPHHFIREWGISAADPTSDGSGQQNILLYGAGARGGLYVRERYLLHSEELGQKNIVGFIDDNQKLRKQFLFGIVVLGTLHDIETLVKAHRIDEVVITTYITDENFQRLVDVAQRLGFRVSGWSVYSTEVV